MKTNETLAIEALLQNECMKNHTYGTEEVTIGFAKDGHGDEIVDFMSMDSESVFRCYEIKVSYSDLKSEAKKSFYGDLNYIAVTPNVDRHVPDWDDHIPPSAGIILACAIDSEAPYLEIKRRAKKTAISDEQREMLKDSLIRSMYYKMNNYKTRTDPESYKQLKKEYDQLEASFEQYKQKTEYSSWLIEDYERYYALNHGTDGFSLESDAKVQRSQYMKRVKEGFTWISNGETYVCPVCGKPAVDGVRTGFCPHCGADLK